MRTAFPSFLCLFLLLLALSGESGAALIDPSGDPAGPECGALRSSADAQTTIYFSDDFEGGLGNWALSGGEWGLTETSSHSFTHSLTDSPSGNYGSSWSASAALASSLNLSSATAPVLTFWHRVDLAIDGNDWARVQVSTNGGTSWTTLRTWPGSRWVTWALEQVDLSSYKSSNVKIRFWLTTDSDATVGDGWYIDDVEIKEKDPVKLSFPFYDSFESGLGNWIVSGYEWALTEEESHTVTHSLTDSPGSNYGSLWSTSAILAHPIDLSGTTSPMLTFWHKMDLAGDGNDWARIEVSTNGGMTWTTLEYWDGHYWTTWAQDQIDLSSYKTSSVKIRFWLTTDSDGIAGAGWHVDDVEIHDNSIGVEKEQASPRAFELSQNYPNPFNPLCTIRYSIPQADRVTLRLFNVVGTLVRTLVDGRREPGVYREIWDGRAEDGSALPSGVYFYRLEAGAFVAVRKMVLLR